MEKKFFWSDDPEDGTRIVFKTPDSPPPHCGMVREDVQEFDMTITTRSCCSCLGEWKCNEKEAIYGACPHCGATGPFGGNKGVLAKLSKKTIDFNSLPKLSILPFESGKKFSNKDFLREIKEKTVEKFDTQFSLVR